MNKKHQKTLVMIFEKPARSDVRWSNVETLLVHIGAEIREGHGSRVRIALHGIRAVFYRPHRKRETDKGALISMRRFLENAGVKP